MHYLDDFLIIGKPQSEECAGSVALTQAVCQKLGVLQAMRKCEGPTCSLTFLGVLIDTMAMELCLPPKRLEQLAKTVNQWRLRKSCKKRDLLALIGQLQHACAVNDRPVDDSKRVAPFYLPQYELPF